MTESDVERVARAIDDADKAWWHSVAEPALGLAETLARAAIAAMQSAGWKSPDTSPKSIVDEGA